MFSAASSTCHQLTTYLEVAKDGDASIGTRAQAAGDAVCDKFDQHKHEVRCSYFLHLKTFTDSGKQTKADVHKEAAKH
jgi:hypothetical protein